MNSIWKSVVSFLTLRYDVFQDVPLFRLNETDFDQYGVSFDDSKEMVLNYVNKVLSNVHDDIILPYSGGVDSSLIKMVLDKRDVSYKTLCVGFYGDIEEDADHKIMYDKILPYVKKNIAKYGLVRGALLYSDMCINLMKDKYVVTGDGSDEIFAGYDFRYRKYSKCGSYQKFHEVYNRHRPRDYVNIDSMFCFDSSKINDQIRAKIDDCQWSDDIIDNVLMADFNLKFRCDFFSTLTKVMEIEKIRISYPLLCRFATHLPMKYKYNRGKGKIILRSILTDNNIESKQKRGFGYDPVDLWTNELCEINFEKLGIVEDNKINKSWVRHAVKVVEDKNDRAYINKLYDLYVVDLYMGDKT